MIIYPNDHDDSIEPFRWWWSGICGLPIVVDYLYMSSLCACVDSDAQYTVKSRLNHFERYQTTQFAGYYELM